MQQAALDPYIELISQFTEGRIGVGAFEHSYLRLFKDDPTRWSEEAFAVLDRLFAEVDAYCGDPALRGERDIDAGELKARSEEALSELRTLSGKTQSAAA